MEEEIKLGDNVVRSHDYNELALDVNLRTFFTLIFQFGLSCFRSVTTVDGNLDDSQVIRVETCISIVQVLPPFREE